MKKILIFIGVAIVLVGGLLAFNGQGNETTTESSNEYAQVQQALNDGAALLDVRTPAEYDEGHIAGAELFPLQQIEAGTLPDVEKDQTIYVYCRSGNRSAEATRLLTQAGYTDIVDLGGMQNVVAMGAEVN